MSGTGVCVVPAAGTQQTVAGDPGRVLGTRVEGLTSNGGVEKTRVQRTQRVG